MNREGKKVAIFSKILVIMPVIRVKLVTKNMRFFVNKIKTVILSESIKIVSKISELNFLDCEFSNFLSIRQQQPR